MEPVVSNAATKVEGTWVASQDTPEFSGNVVTMQGRVPSGLFGKSGFWHNISIVDGDTLAIQAYEWSVDKNKRKNNQLLIPCDIIFDATDLPLEYTCTLVEGGGLILTVGGKRSPHIIKNDIAGLTLRFASTARCTRLVRRALKTFPLGATG